MKCLLCREGELEPAEMNKWEQVVNDLLPLQAMTCNNCEKRLPGPADPLWTKKRIVVCASLAVVFLLSVLGMLIGGEEEVVEEPTAASVADLVIEEPEDKFPKEDLMEEGDGKVVEVSERVLAQLERNRAKAAGKPYEQTPKLKPRRASPDQADPQAGVDNSSSETSQPPNTGAEPATTSNEDSTGEIADGQTTPLVDGAVENNSEGTPGGDAAIAEKGRSATITVDDARAVELGPSRPLQGVSAQNSNNGFSIVVLADAPITNHPWFVIDSEKKLVVDLVGNWSATTPLPPVISVDGPLVRRVRIGRNTGFLRLVLDLQTDRVPSLNFTPTATGLTISWQTGS